MWKIIFPVILCLAETGTTDTVKTLPAHRNAEIFATLPNIKPCITDDDVTSTENTSSSGYSTTISAAVTTVNESIGTTVEESTALAPRNRMPDAAFGDTTVAARDTTTANEYEGATVVTHTAPPGVSYTATKNASRSVSSFTASEQTLSSTVVTATSPGSSTSQNGTQSVDTGNFTSLSPRMTTRAIFRKTNIPDHEDTTYGAKTRDPGEAAHYLHEPYGNTPENAGCYSTCDVIPAWATVLLCLATAFFLFMIVGFIFLLPYCTKRRHPTPGPCSA